MTNKYNSIPEEMKARNQWVNYAMMDKKKVPFNHKTRKACNVSTDENQFSFEEVVAAENRYDGVGISLGKGLIGIDIDNCIDENGNLSEEANYVLNNVNSYAERSVSKNGIHIYALGNINLSKNRESIPFNGRTDLQASGIEIYTEKRYFVVTGDVIPGHTELTECSDSIQKVIARFFEKREDKILLANGTAAKIVETALNESVDLVIQKIKNGKERERFESLMAGDLSDYPDQSRADIALCGIIARHSEGDPKIIEAIARKSELQRDKWDSPRNNGTWIEYTMNSAIENYEKYEEEKRQKKCDSTLSGSVNAQLAEVTEVDNTSDTKKALDGNSNILAPTHTSEQAIVVADTTRVCDFNEIIDNLRNDYAFDDSHDGDIFALSHSNLCRYCADRKNWMVYKNGQWSTDYEGITTSQYLTEFTYMLLREIRIQYGYSKSVEAIEKHLCTWNSNAKKKKILNEAKRLALVKSSEFDSDNNLINCINGTYNLKTFALQEHNAGDLLSKSTNVIYDANAKCERFEQFISEIFYGDIELISYVQKLLGYCMCGNPQLEQFYILYGPSTRNGKTTLVETIGYMLGDYAKTLVPEAIMHSNIKSSTGHNEPIARLEGARFVSCSETKEDVKLDSSVVKNLTGGNILTARYLWGYTYEISRNFVLVIDTNHLPEVTDKTLFASNRVVVIPFNRHFSEDEQDKSLKALFKSPKNVSGIFNWCLEGYKNFLSEGLNAPKAVKAATEEYCNNSDEIQSFVRDCLVPRIGGRLSTSVLYKLFADYIGSTRISQRVFMKKLREYYTVEEARPEPGKAPRNCLLDFALREEITPHS